MRGLLVPPFQKLEHQAGDFFGWGRDIPANEYPDGSVPSGGALIHHLAGNHLVQLEHVFVLQRRFLEMLLDEAQPGKVIEHFAPRPVGNARQVAAFLDSAHLFQGQRS